MAFRLCILFVVVLFSCQKKEPQGFVSGDQLSRNEETCLEEFQDRAIAVFRGESNFFGFSGMCLIADMDQVSDDKSDKNFFNFTHLSLTFCRIRGFLRVYNLSPDMEGDTIEILPRRINDFRDGLVVADYQIITAAGNGMVVEEEYKVLPVSSHRSWLYIERVNEWESEWEGTMQLAMVSTLNSDRWADPDRPDTLIIEDVHFVINKVK